MGERERDREEREMEEREMGERESYSGLDANRMMKLRNYIHYFN